MSAPDTNLERQKQRHVPSLAAITIAGTAVVLAIFVLALWPQPLAEEPALPDTTTTVEQ